MMMQDNQDKTMTTGMGTETMMKQGQAHGDNNDEDQTRKRRNRQ
jgi:hypothetical protein